MQGKEELAFAAKLMPCDLQCLKHFLEQMFSTRKTVFRSVGSLQLLCLLDETAISTSFTFASTINE